MNQGAGLPSRGDPWLAGLARAVIARARRVVVFTLIGVLGAIYYTAGHLGINTDTGNLFSDELEWRKTYLRYADTFPVFSNNLILVIDGPTPETTEAAADALVARLAEDDSGLLEWVYPPRGGLFFKRNALLYLEAQELADLADNLAAIQPFLGRLASEPSLHQLFAITTLAIQGVEQVDADQLAGVVSRLARSTQRSLDGSVSPLPWREIIQGRPATGEERRAVVLVKPRLDYQKLLPTGELIAHIRQVAAQLRMDESRGLRLRITGELAMSHEELDSVSRGGLYAAISAVVMVFVVLMLGLRSLRLVFASIVTLLAGLACTAAFAALAVGHLNLISVAFAVLYIGLGIDFAVHFCLRYRDLLMAGHEGAAALTHAMEDIGGTLFVCALTTGVGFFSFVGTDFTGVSELGLISGGGMFVSLAASIVFLPALLTLMPLRAATAPRAPEVAGDTPRPRIPILTVTAVLAVVSLVAVGKVEFDRNPISVREADSEAVSTFMDLLRESETPPWPLVTLAEPGEVAALARRVEALELVDGTLSIEDFVPRDQDTKLPMIDDLALILSLDAATAEIRDDDPAQVTGTLRSLQVAVSEALGGELPPQLRAALARLEPSLEALEAQLALPGSHRGLLQRLNESLLQPLVLELGSLEQALLADRVALEDLPAELTGRWIAPDGRHRVEIFAAENIRDSKALGRFVAAVRVEVPDATDSPVTLLESGNVVVSAFQQAILTALALITLILAVLLRSLRDVLMVLAPLVLAACFTVAAMVLMGIAFNFANVITLPLLLGIGVDNGIHIVRRARSMSPGGGNLLHTSTARAVVVSALTTICSFGNLALSAHPGTASMGQVLAVGLSFNLLCTLLVLPALLDRFPAAAPR